jgi:hypothetical protein
MVIAIQAGPVYAVFMADLKDQSLNMWQQAWIWGSIFLSLAICSGALYFPMAFGVRRLSELRA